MDHSPPPIFGVIQKGGPVEVDEMRRAFNMGIGLVAIVSASRAAEAQRVLEDAGERAWIFGSVETAAADSEPTVSVVG